MPKKVVPLVTNERYHIYNRGVDKRNIFIDKFDYIRFYQSLAYFNTIEATQNFRLAKYHHTKQHKRLVEIEAYCLLPNHYHMILKQTHDSGVSEFMKRVSAGYTGYFNDKHKRSGSLFQGVFKRVHIENDALYSYLFSYVNENHVVHGLVRDSDICYSSAAHYQGITRSNLILDDRPYNAGDAKKLALSIYRKRHQYAELLE